MGGGAWWAAVHGVAKSRTRLSDFTFTFHFHALEKEMATHSSVLAWRIPGMGEPGGLPSLGSQSQTRLKQLSSSSSVPSLHLRSGEWGPISLEAEDLHKLLGILPGRLSILTHLFTYFIIYLHRYEFMDVYIILWVIIQYYFIDFVAHIKKCFWIVNSYLKVRYDLGNIILFLRVLALRIT